MKIVTQAIPTVLFNDDSKLWLTIQVCRKWRTQNTVYSTSIAMSANETAVWCSVIGHTQSDETNRCTNSSVHIHTVCLCVYVCMWLQRQRQAEEQQQQQEAASLRGFNRTLRWEIGRFEIIRDADFVFGSLFPDLRTPLQINGCVN